MWNEATQFDERLSQLTYTEKKIQNRWCGNHYSTRDEKLQDGAIHSYTVVRPRWKTEVYRER